MQNASLIGLGVSCTFLQILDCVSLFYLQMCAMCVGFPYRPKGQKWQAKTKFSLVEANGPVVLVDWHLKAYSYRFIVNIIKSYKLRKPMTANLFIPRVSVSCLNPALY